MGKELYDNFAPAKEVYDLCESLRPGTLAQCFYGTGEELKETKNTQPCLFVMELAAARVLLSKGITPQAAAGFSLGEVAAAAMSGVLDKETGFALVIKRGELMQREAEKFDTAMASVVKLSAPKVQEICDRYEKVYPVNFNCPGQIAVSGLATQMAKVSVDVRAAGGRAIPLKVRGAFHSPFMTEAAEAFGEELNKAALHKPDITLYSDMTAEPYGEDAGKLLSGQICHPVQWEKLIRNMIADGIDTFIEIGPGQTLTNMMKRIDCGVKAMTVNDCLGKV
jgi:[acyl-carrier-protein] S-malonyltransferase